MKHLRYGTIPLALLLIAGCSSSNKMNDSQQSDVADAASATMGMMKTPTLFDSPELERKYQETITASDLEAHLYLFASDYFEGRETATGGEQLAALYLASQYKKMGLAPKGTANDKQNVLSQYFQPFPVYSTLLKNSTLTVSKDGTPIGTSHFNADLQDEKAYPLSTSGPAEASGPLVFGGYGIEDADLGLEEISALKATGIKLADHWVLLLGDEPMSGPEKSMLATADGKPSAWTTNTNMKLRALFGEDMPKGILIVSDIGPREKPSIKESAMLQASRLNDVNGLSLTKPDGSPGRFRRPPTYSVSADFANKLLSGSGKTVADLQKGINSSLKPAPFVIEGVNVNSTFETGARELHSANVAAFVEGSDLKDEVIVISSHYDHIGVGSGEGDVINNGADDDGSGTVTILEIAEAFQIAKDNGNGPRRSILFLNVAGEEKGLLGSAYYADSEPLLPLEKTVTNLNIDMIGRHDPTHPDEDPNYVYIIGSKLISQDLHDLNARANQVAGTGLDLNERFNSKDDPNRFYARSDHWNFGKHNIPFIFFFTGTHEDYHRVGDEPHKIDYDRMAKIGQMIFATAWQVANQDAVPAVSGEGFN